MSFLVTGHNKLFLLCPSCFFTRLPCLSVQRSLLLPGRLSCQARVCPWMATIIKMRKAGMMVAGSATVTTERKCVPSSPARCLPAATPPFVPDSAARPAQVKAVCPITVQPPPALWCLVPAHDSGRSVLRTLLSCLWLLLLTATD